MHPILKQLAGTDRRSIGGANHGVKQVQSRIVKTFAMQALADMAEQDAALKPAILKQIAYLTQTGSPAMKSRGKKLLAKLKGQKDSS